MVIHCKVIGLVFRSLRRKLWIVSLFLREMLHVRNLILFSLTRMTNAWLFLLIKSVKKTQNHNHYFYFNPRRLKSLFRCFFDSTKNIAFKINCVLWQMVMEVKLMEVNFHEIKIILPLLSFFLVFKNVSFSSIDECENMNFSKNEFENDFNT